MWRRRLSAVLVILLLIASLVALDLWMLTLPAVVRDRMKRDLAKTFKHASTFRHPTADFGGRMRIEDFVLWPTHRRYKVMADEIETRLQIAHTILRKRPNKKITIRGMTLEWIRGTDGRWDLDPFLRFCAGLDASSLPPTRIKDFQIVLRQDPEGPSYAFPFDVAELEMRRDGVFIHARSNGPPWGLFRMEVTADPGAGEYRGSILVRSLRIQPEWIAVLPKGLADALATLRPRGTVDLEVFLRPAGRSEMVIRPSNLALRPRSFPYPLRKIAGEVRVDAGGIQVQSLEGRSGMTRFEGTGRFPLPGEAGESRLDVVWSDLQMNATLLAALPEHLEWIWRRTRASGTIGAHVALFPSSGLFWGAEGSIPIERLVLDLRMPVTIEGVASVKEGRTGLLVGLEGTRIAALGLPLGEVREGSANLGDREIQIPTIAGKGEAGSFRGKFHQVRDWPSPWDASLHVNRHDLGEALGRLSDGGGASGGRWRAWLGARGDDEDGASGRGAVWISASEGRRLPILEKIFPPRDGLPDEIRGRLSIEVADGAIRVPAVLLSSGPERAVGQGWIGPDGRIRFEIVRTSSAGLGGRVGGGRATVSPGPVRVILEGPATRPIVRTVAAGGFGGGRGP